MMQSACYNEDEVYYISTWVILEDELCTLNLKPQTVMNQRLKVVYTHDAELSPYAG